MRTVGAAAFDAPLPQIKEKRTPNRQVTLFIFVPSFTRSWFAGPFSRECFQLGYEKAGLFPNPSNAKLIGFDGRQPTALINRDLRSCSAKSQPERLRRIWHIEVNQIIIGHCWRAPASRP